MKSVPTSPTLDEAKGEPAAYRFRLNPYRLAMASIWTVAIMTVCWLPGHMVRKLEDESSWFKIPDLDKVVHAGIFVLFSILWFGVWTSRRRFLWVTIGGIGLAMLTEAVQNLPVVGRDGSVADTLTDVAGVFVGILAAPIVEPLACWAESRIFRKSGPRPLRPNEPSPAPDGSVQARSN